MRKTIILASLVASACLAGGAAVAQNHDNLTIGTQPLGGGTNALIGIPYPDNVSVRAKWINPELATPPAARAPRRLVDPGITVILPGAQRPASPPAE